MRAVLSIFLAAIFILATPRPAHAEYKEYAFDLPSSLLQPRHYNERDKGQIKEQVKTGDQKTRRYNVYLPNGDTTPKPYKRAAILLLHGSQRSGASLVERWREIADANDVILIGPHAEGSFDVNHDTQYLLPAVLADATKKYSIDTKRIYLFGHSMGGIYACLLAMVMPDTFAAIGIHAGMIPENNYAALSKEGRKTPIVMVNGTHDKVFPISSVRKAAKAFDAHGYDVDLYIMKNHTHWYYTAAPMLNELVWGYFKAKTLD